MYSQENIPALFIDSYLLLNQPTISFCCDNSKDVQLMPVEEIMEKERIFAKSTIYKSQKI